jgi:EpsD family peptidyl-prolyl cis-trans isomerase
MTIWNRPAAMLRIGILIGLGGLALAACSKKNDVQTEASKSQVVAKVGDQVVTIQELDNEFRLANVPVSMRKDPEAVKRILGELVARKYMVKQALDAKLDREPTVLLDILRSKELVLANALVARDVTTKSEAISQADIDGYMKNNPLKFANRQILSVEQISVPLSATSQAVIDATKEMKTLDEVDQKLTAMGVQHGRSTGAISSGDLPPELVDRVMVKQPDDIFFLRAGVNGVFFKVTGETPNPLEGEAAINAARQFIRQDIIKSELSMISVSANLGTKFEGDYASIMGQNAGSAPK